MPENPRGIAPLHWRALVDEALRRRRLERLTQREHAALAGASVPTVAAFDRGETTLTLAKAFDILRVVGLVAEPDQGDAQEAFVQDAFTRWRRRADTLPPHAPERFPHGWYRFDYGLEGALKTPDLAAFGKILREVARHGGSAFRIPAQKDQGLTPADGGLECRLGPVQREGGDRGHHDPSLYDFWRADPSGRLFLIRGYQEDGQETFPPGSILDTTLPIWRIGEALRHAARLASLLRKSEGTAIAIRFRAVYSGLSGRILRSWANPLSGLLAEGRTISSDAARSDEVTLEAIVPAEEIDTRLPDHVLPLAASLYATFGVTGLSYDHVQAAIDRLLKRLADPAEANRSWRASEGEGMMYAHSLHGQPATRWEPLSDHLKAVAGRAADFAAAFGWSEAARAAGLLHDIGKTSAEFQAYIAQPRVEGSKAKGPDHSTAGAKEAVAAFPGLLGGMLARLVAGHHAGLDDAAGIERRLSPDHRVPPYAGWRGQSGDLPAMAALRPTQAWKPGRHPGFTEAFLTRMLFSCLVDADFLETEAFHDRAEGQTTPRAGHTDITTLRDRLRGFMAGIDGRSSDPVSALRSLVLAAAVAKAEAAPGLFTLTVPTGGGKTLASLSFALEHAARHGLRRVIHVAPFTSIIEQTAGVFRGALGTEDDVLEHHANFDWREDDEAEEGRDGLRKLRRAAENWDVPVVVTTAVQFFESLFANRTARCRKLHNLAQSVIVLDEAQALPIHLLRPCMAAIEELARNYGASIVLCTATQPALRAQDGFKGGLEIGADREIAPDPRALYTALKRVRVEVLPGLVPDAVVAARFVEQPQMLCIVNSRAHARELFEAIRALPGAIHLSTLMVPRHRREVLDEVRRRVKAGEPARIVSTSLIEAGVDLDVPEVWRAAAGLDSIAQAAGRCNRNGRLPMGRTVVFEPAEAKPPRALEAFWQATRPVLRGHDDLLGLDAVRAYFQELYWQKGEAALDAAVVDGRPGVMPALAERAASWGFPFRSLAEAFHLIDEAMEPVVLPWNEEAARLLREIGAADRPPAGHLRRLQSYTVSIPREARGRWLALGALQSVHPLLGDGLLKLEDRGLYKDETGLDLTALGLRAAERNLF